MAGLRLENISKSYDGKNFAVRDFNLEIQDREFVILVGPSGCGKTTTLRMIAGLEEITQGDLFIDGTRMNDVEPKDRDIAMVFQNYALYPHMTVFDNMAFGLKQRRVPKAERERAVREAASILGLEELLKRKPKELSGGQRQRVAMGRAIVRDPKVFLMDEPLSNLDAKLRSQMRVEIANLHQRLGATIVYVTHDQTEAMTLGTKIVVMNEGVIQQIDSPKALYDRPRNLFVAQFIGSPQMNVFEAVFEVREGEGVLKGAGADLPLSAEQTAALVGAGYQGKTVMAGIRPEDIYPDGERDDRGTWGKLDAVVGVCELLGAEANLYFTCGGVEMIAKMHPDTRVCPGDSMALFANTKKLHVFDKDTELNIIHTV